MFTHSHSYIIKQTFKYKMKNSYEGCLQFYLKTGNWFSPIIFLQNLLFKCTLCKISEVLTLLFLDCA